MEARRLIVCPSMHTMVPIPVTLSPASHRGHGVVIRMSQSVHPPRRCSMKAQTTPRVRTVQSGQISPACSLAFSVALVIDADNPYSSDLTLARTCIKTDNSEVEVLEDDPRLEEEFRGLCLNDVAARDDEKEVDQHGIEPGQHTNTKFIQDMLKLEIQRSTRNPPMPWCYEQQMYWVWDSSLYLTLLSQPRAPLEPAVFHRPKFFIWLPHCLLGDHIPCPQCKAVGHRSSKGHVVYLQKQGFIENVRWVVDIN